MRIVFAFFVCTIATYAMFNYVFGVHITDVVDKFFLIFFYLLCGSIGAAIDHYYPIETDFGRPFRKLGDLIVACTERMRKD